ncbi:MAG: HAD-IIA family hydrolase [Dysgonamonadaceae bacterium]|jgi:NagD protein|nr:HAD-IIA family hydrolase [Dysgonamonadaceae bacterium]
MNDRLKRLRLLALDMDGTIYKGSTLFPFTLKFLADMKSIGIDYVFLTNNPSKSTQDYLTHLKEIGINATKDELYTSGEATIDYLKHRHPEFKRLFILGTPSLIGEFEAAGYVSTADSADDRPDAVIASFDRSLVYSRLCRAAWWVHEGLPYIATNPDRVCPTDQPVVLVDCGSICAAIEQAAGRKPDVIIGKPEPRMLEGIMQRRGLKPDEVAMVGDRIYTDIAMAKNTNTLGVLVLSGESTAEDLKNASVLPDIVADDLAMLGRLIQEAKG